MNRTKIIFFIFLLLLLLTTGTSCKNKDKDIYRDEALYIDKNGITRFDPTKIKKGDKINGWKVVNVDIKKLNQLKIKRYYSNIREKDRKDFSAEVTFEGNIEIRGLYNFTSYQVPTDFIAVNFDFSISDNKSKQFPRLNYEKNFEQCNLIIENYEDVTNALSENKGFAPGIKGEATFIIDKYTIMHVDNELSFYYGSIHIVDVKDVKIIRGYDEAVKEEEQK